MKQISFLINCSKNTRDHLELLIRSLHTNLDGKEHEIIVFIDSDNENIEAYLRTVKGEFYDLKIITHSITPCIGYARNNNILVDLAKHDICSYIQSDMVISPHYDTNILYELKENCILSSTRVEPPLHGYSDYTITKDFGTDPTIFNLADWNQYSKSIRSNKSAVYFFAPITFYKKVWQDLGGYDTIFRRAREDSDFVQRAVHAEIELIQTWEANVYHFTCVSSRGKSWFDDNNGQAKKRNETQKIADGIELRRFIQKWGNFNHGESKLDKLDIDLVIKDNKKLNPTFISQLEPFFSRVWLNSEEARIEVINLFHNEHDIANELLGFSKKDWELSKKYYNTVDFSSIYQVGEPKNYNIKVEVSFDGVDSNNDLFLKNLTNISAIIKPSEPGNYELGCAKIFVNKVVSTSQQKIKVENPPFDYSLLTIS
jgi:hypothetical protein